VRFVDISSDSVDWWDGLARPVELAPSAREKVKSRMDSITAHTTTPPIRPIHIMLSPREQL